MILPFSLIRVQPSASILIMRWRCSTQGHELINGVESKYSAEPKVWIFSESGRIYDLDIGAFFLLYIADGIAALWYFISSSLHSDTPPVINFRVNHDKWKGLGAMSNWDPPTKACSRHSVGKRREVAVNGAGCGGEEKNREKLESSRVKNYSTQASASV